MTDTLRFPDGFLFGASISAYQTEGGNTNADWWWWEHIESTPCREPSGDACDFYHRGHEDVAMVADLGLNAFRFGIEWARIEPAEGEFSRAALAHYRGLLDACHERGIVPMVTFHHFTVPRWLHELGGFAYERFPSLFERYCDRAAAALGDRIGYACTINEPQGLGSSGWLLGINPPGHTDDRDGAQRAVDNLLEAHRLGAAAIRARAGVPTGVTLALPDLQYEDGASPGTSSLELESKVSDWFFELARQDDFIGVQTYTRFRYGPEGPRSPGNDWSDTTRELYETDETTQMGYEFYPQALGGAIRRAHRSCPGVPILVTESGIATGNDEKRIAYIDRALREVLACLGEGIDVRSYMYWSLLDNFEWALGYAPTFGLVGVDRQTFARHPRPSAAWLGSVARARAVGSAAGSPLAGEVAQRAGGGF
ncbi:MAG: glycoside hydrolase family 1 protein [Chloroflexi bacterium]|nr:MAG: glycoside hydrolase family 1 protein [Chloroflexota bacterium]